MSEQNDLAAADQAIIRIAKERGWPDELVRRMIGGATTALLEAARAKPSPYSSLPSEKTYTGSFGISYACYKRVKQITLMGSRLAPRR
ncbi:MAG TPA: hypothetical protein VMV13_12980 [Candidatus Binataceae bacterium]|nr:hypothetical protein [Candidatus Binataceae bacterium]